MPKRMKKKKRRKISCVSKMQVISMGWKYQDTYYKISLKFVFAYLYIFHQEKALGNYEKCLLFHQKSSFCSRDI